MRAKRYRYTVKDLEGIIVYSGHLHAEAFAVAKVTRPDFEVIYEVEWYTPDTRIPTQ